MSTETAPRTDNLADDLGVDGELLLQFVRNHPNPTPAIVIGWARSRGELRARPEQLRPDVEAWIDANRRGGGR